MGSETISVDVIVPMRNEAANVREFLAMVRAQSLQPARIIVADGMSSDGSRALLEAAKQSMSNLVVIDNPERVVPAALNACLKQVRSPVVARMDMHATYDVDYLSCVTQVLSERSNVVGVGGAMETAGRGAWGKAIASTLRRPFGLGGARHRVGGSGGPISHVFSGCYRTESLREIEGWDERFSANEDFEADTRLRALGGELWLSTEAKSTWFVRESPKRLAIQMWRYGFYKALTLVLHPESMQPRQLAPPALVLLLVVGSTFSARRTGKLAAAYVTSAALLGAGAAYRDGSSPLRGAVIPPIVHLSWGAGLLCGLVRFTRVRNALLLTSSRLDHESNTRSVD